MTKKEIIEVLVEEQDYDREFLETLPKADLEEIYNDYSPKEEDNAYSDSSSDEGLVYGDEVETKTEKELVDETPKDEAVKPLSKREIREKRRSGKL